MTPSHRWPFDHHRIVAEVTLWCSTDYLGMGQYARPQVCADSPLEEDEFRTFGPSRESGLIKQGCYQPTSLSQRLATTVLVAHPSAKMLARTQLGHGTGDLSTQRAPPRGSGMTNLIHSNHLRHGEERLGEAGAHHRHAASAISCAASKRAARTNQDEPSGTLERAR